MVRSRIADLFDIAMARHVGGMSSVNPEIEVEDQAQGADRERQFERQFGQHVRSLRRSRGMTQEVLAEVAGVAADTIRRLEHGSFSPSLLTLRKLVSGLDIQLSTLFTSFELGERCVPRELLDLLDQLTPIEQDALVQFVRAFHRPARSR
jgi:transcriptional regulator with XRE-family HTH domain